MGIRLDFMRRVGAAIRPEPGATTNGSGRNSALASNRRRQVVVVAADLDSAARHAATRYGFSSTGPEVTLVTSWAAVAGLEELRLRRCDTVDWVPGWYGGPDGQAFAAVLERCCEVGVFGTARYVFATD